MNKPLRNLVSFMVLLALAGTLAGAGYHGAEQAGFVQGNTGNVITGDNSCMRCLDYCNTEYATCVPYRVFCRFSCWMGTCRIPPYP
jgi:hypothetical protein